MKAVVLSSGGVDSTTCVSLAVDLWGKENVSTVSFFYGQKHNKELECAKKIAQYYGVNHYELDIASILKYSDCSLLASSKNEIPEGEYFQQIGKDEDGQVSTYVPFRNGLMLSAVASLAMSIYPKERVNLYIGAHADDAAGNAYADCSETFTNHMKNAIYTGTYNRIHVIAPFVTKHKKDIVALGLEYNTPYELTWSCYNGGDTPCGKCATCIDRQNAFELNGATDPLIGGEK